MTLNVYKCGDKYDFTEASGRNPEWIILKLHEDNPDQAIKLLMDKIAFERKTTNFTIKIVEVAKL